MGSIERPPPAHAKRDAARADLQRFRNAIQARLQAERIQFAASSALLARGDGGQARLFEDVNFRAHRLHGLAAMFELGELAAAAHTLERVCTAALECTATRTEETVSTALLALVQTLGDLCGDRPPHAAAAASQVAGPA